MIAVLGAFDLGLLVAVGIFPERAAQLYTSAVHCVLLDAGLLLRLVVKRAVFPTDRPPPA